MPRPGFFCLGFNRPVAQITDNFLAVKRAGEIFVAELWQNTGRNESTSEQQLSIDELK
jgi:hypothetical protein